MLSVPGDRLIVFGVGQCNSSGRLLAGQGNLNVRRRYWWASVLIVSKGVMHLGKPV